MGRDSFVVVSPGSRLKIKLFLQVMRELLLMNADNVHQTMYIGLFQNFCISFNCFKHVVSGYFDFGHPNK